MSELLFVLMICTSIGVSCLVGYGKGHRDGYRSGYLRGRWSK